MTSKQLDNDLVTESPGTEPIATDAPAVRMIEPFRPKIARPIKSDMKEGEEEIGPNNKSLEELANSQDRKIVIEKTNFERSKSDMPLRNVNHSVVLLNVTHQGQRPKHKFPGFRILGAFPNTRALNLHVNRHYEGSNASLRMTPVHQLMTICESDERQDDRSHNKRQIEALVKIYSDAADAREADFKHNVDKGTTGSVGKSIYKSKLKCMKAMEEQATTFEKQHEADGEDHLPHNISTSGEISDQRFAAIIVLSDIRKVVAKGQALPEPCLAILDVFSTEEQAMKYAKHTASRAYPKCDVDVVDMYTWHFPENIHPDKIKDVYGHKRLNEVMTARKENAVIADDFESWCKENGIEPTVTEIGGEEIPSPMSLPSQGQN